MAYASEAGLLSSPRFRLAKKQNGRRWLRRLVWTVVTLGAMAGTTELLLNPPAFVLQKPETIPQQEARWTEIRQPIPVYSFSGGPFERAADQYGARRHSDGSRIDSMSYGQFASAAAGKNDWMRIQLHRLTGRPSAPPAFFVDMARLASADGLAVTGNTFPSLIETRFGGFAVSDLDVSNGSAHSKCLGYRMLLEKPAFRISGIACGTAKAPIDRRMLTCILNRLDVTSARDDKTLGRFFANAELKRNPSCDSRKLAGFRNRAAWLDQITSEKAVGALRLSSLAGRNLRR